MRKLLQKVRDGYAGSDVFLQNKAVTLFGLCLFLSFGFALFSAVRMVDASWGVAIGEAVASVLFFGSAFLILRGQFRFASVFIQLVALGTAVALYAIQNPQGLVSVFMLPAYLFPVFILMPMIAFSRWQVGFTLAFLAGAETVVFLLHRHEVPVFTFVILLLLIIMSSAITWQTFQVQTSSFRSLGDLFSKEHSRMEVLRGLVAESSSGLEVGRQVLDAARETQASVRVLGTAVESMDRSLHHTSESLSESLERAGSLRQSQSQLDGFNTEQAQVVRRSTEILHEMTTDLARLAQRADGSVQAVKELADRADQGTRRVEAALGRFQAVNQSAEALLDVIRVIEDISQRTNLLAMNASIEAAHAGASGRGFAVVAHEIRKLAEETARNSASMRDSLQQNSDSLGALTGESQALGREFQALQQQSRTVSQAMEALGSELRTSVAHSDGILSILGQLDRVSQQVREAVQTLGALADAQARSTEEVGGHVADLGANVQAVEAASQALGQQADALAQAGQDNLDRNEHLQSRLDQLNV